MTIQQLQYFVALGKYLHFGDAAKACFVSQPSLSKSISELENEMGVSLVFRNNKTVELTPAGKDFYKHATDIMKTMDAATLRAKRLACGQSGELKISFLRTYAFGYFSDFICEFRNRHKDIDLIICQEGLHATSANILTGAVDIALTYNIEVNTIMNDINWLCISPTRYCLVMRKDHPLAGKENIQLEDLKKESFVFIDRNVIPNAFKDTMRLCTNHGLLPNITFYADKISFVCTLVRAGMGIAILPDTAKVYCTDNICFIPIDGDDAITYSGLAWKKNHNNPAISMFVEDFRTKILNKA